MAVWYYTACLILENYLLTTWFLFGPGITDLYQRWQLICTSRLSWPVRLDTRHYTDRESCTIREVNLLSGLLQMTNLWDSGTRLRKQPCLWRPTASTACLIDYISAWRRRPVCCWRRKAHQNTLFNRRRIFLQSEVEKIATTKKQTNKQQKKTKQAAFSELICHELWLPSLLLSHDIFRKIALAHVIKLINLCAGMTSVFQGFIDF